jgi:undecaprenyl diphosphate synthase
MAIPDQENSIPEHIAVIMDGNGRWARNRGLSRISGHREGVKRVKEIVLEAGREGVKVLTLFAFSTENWSRPKGEVNMLMRLLSVFLNSEIKKMCDSNIRLMIIGERSSLPKFVQEKMRYAEEKTRLNSGLKLVLAVNYGARQEIVNAVKKIAEDLRQGLTRIEDIGVENFSGYLYTAGLPEPDLLIRTSGELRISNFLLWQLSYTELYFVKKNWPDFDGEDLREAIKEYKKRQRRFGAVDGLKG